MSGPRHKPRAGLIPSTEPLPVQDCDRALMFAARSSQSEGPLSNWLLPLVSVCFLASLLIAPPSGAAFEIRQAGQLQVPAGAHLFAFSTDPTIQEVLSQDVNAATRGPDSAKGSTVTVSVNVTQQILSPGVSLAKLAPGDPQVADLMKAAGANPPPLGDTGNQYDEAALARRLAARDYMPNDTQSARLINSIANPGEHSEGFGPPIPLPCSALTVARPGCPPVPEATPAATATKSIGDVQEYVERKKQTQGWFAGRQNNDYDTVVVARASVSGQAEEMTLVAISHPGEDINDAKKQIAERIANSILH
jgi:hypothetical protein